MKHILILNKFDIDLDKFKEKIREKLGATKIIYDNDRLMVECESDAASLSGLHEIQKIYTVNKDWTKLDFKKMKKEALDAVMNNKYYLIETKFFDKIPISAKSIYSHINPYLKHEGIIPDKNNPEIILHIELKKENNKIYYRICTKAGMIKNSLMQLDFSNFYAVLEEPRLAEEISDFLRLCFIFNMRLLILTDKEDNIVKLLKKAKEITKGIDYNKFNLKLIPHLSKDFIKVGFSKHCNKNEADLIKFLKENKDSKICLIFGNDTYGLSQNVRDDLDYCFRLTPELKKPLKANQALSYVLGLYAGIGL